MHTVKDMSFTAGIDIKENPDMKLQVKKSGYFVFKNDSKERHGFKLI